LQVGKGQRVDFSYDLEINSIEEELRAAGVIE